MNSESALPWLTGNPAQINQVLTKHLSPLFGKEEARIISSLLLEEIAGMSGTEIHFADQPLKAGQLTDLQNAVMRLKAGEPIQYIIGKVDFCSLQILVGPGVLIPRPETEELVHWVLEEQNQVKKRVLDLCTGSGCMALGLKKMGNWMSVSGLDVSEDALKYAHETSLRNGLEVEWIQADLRDELSFDRKFDVIVANPPYVLEVESAEMAPQVLDFEPHLALFTPNSDPVYFYSAIGLQAL
ncbi:MAG TPA: HemK/PrmC family methyltransferase, partial [Catalimonadaceae bacterium]|nr:HemK/PrmC family methyltransferase [Catalimonadaceae bacterium]